MIKTYPRFQVGDKVRMGSLGCYTIKSIDLRKQPKIEKKLYYKISENSWYTVEYLDKVGQLIDD